MRGRNKNKEIINKIKAGNEEVLLYLFRKYYNNMKHIFQSYSVNEKDIPVQSALVIVKIWMEIRRNDFSDNIDLTSYLLNTARQNAEKISSEKKAVRKNKFRDAVAGSNTPQEIIAECVNVLDTASRKALQWRYSENQSIGKVAEKLSSEDQFLASGEKMDVAAANDFISKAFRQLSSIVKIRMEYAG